MVGGGGGMWLAVPQLTHLWGGCGHRPANSPGAPLCPLRCLALKRGAETLIPPLVPLQAAGVSREADLPLRRVPAAGASSGTRDLGHACKIWGACGLPWPTIHSPPASWSRSRPLPGLRTGASCAQTDMEAAARCALVTLADCSPGEGCHRPETADTG